MIEAQAAALANEWSELIAAVVGALLAWFTKHFIDKRRG